MYIINTKVENTWRIYQKKKKQKEKLKGDMWNDSGM